MREILIPNKEKGTIHDVIKGADVFFGLSAPGVIDENDLKNMAKDPIVFAMANPIPEIMPEDAAGQVAVMATGRSDYPNQINNVLCFPGIFRGALNCRASRINEAMKLAAANAIAGIIGEDELHPDYIIPSVFDRTSRRSSRRASRRSGIRNRRCAARTRDERNDVLIFQFLQKHAQSKCAETRSLRTYFARASAFFDKSALSSP